MSKNITILHYAAPPIVGGVESVIGHHARLMVAAGHRVRIVAGRGSRVNDGIRFVHLPLADSRHPVVLAAKKQLDAGQVPDDFKELVTTLLDSLQRTLAESGIVIAHNVCSLHKNLALTAALRKFCAAPGAPRLIVWHHDLAWTAPRYRAELHNGWPWDLVRQHWAEVHPRHVVVSELRRRELAGLLKLPREEITVVPSGLEISTFLKLEPVTVELVRRLCLLEADPLLLLPVRITTRKNIELALRVLAALRGRFPDAVLVITGPPGPHNPANHEYFERLKALRTELGLDPSALVSEADSGPTAHFLAEAVSGSLPDPVISDLYRLADALFLPSREEGFGIPVLEAGLVGLPVFCADIPPLREIAGDLATYFSPEGDPAEIASLIARQLCAYPPYQLRARVHRNYTWEMVYTERIAPLLEVEP